MPYKINGTQITIQPTYGRWVPRDMIDTDGAGHPVYPARRDFEMRWDLVNAAEWYQLQTFFNIIQNTGTAVVTLPQFAAATYVFYDYTGCVLREPDVSDYFEQHPTSVVMLVTNIKT